MYPLHSLRPCSPSVFALWARALTRVFLQGPRSPLDLASSRSADAARPVGQVDRHIQLLVHGVGQAGKDSRERVGSGQMRFQDSLGLLLEPSYSSSCYALGFPCLGAGWERTDCCDI